MDRPPRPFPPSDSPAAPPPPERKRVAGCSRQGCDFNRPFPIHTVRRCEVSYRLCTSCVLRYHIDSFCSSCFELLSSSSSSSSPLVRCTACPAVAHTACLPDAVSRYLCPRCSDPNPGSFSYFPLGSVSDRTAVATDLSLAKVLHVAARLSAASLARAAAAAWAHAEMKGKEAAAARKRAEELLERVVSFSELEKERRESAKAASMAGTKPKTKAMRTSGTVDAASSAHRKFRQEAEARDRLGSTPRFVNSLAREKALLSSWKVTDVKVEKELPRPIQGVSVASGLTRLH